MCIIIIINNIFIFTSCIAVVCLVYDILHRFLIESYRCMYEYTLWRIGYSSDVRFDCEIPIRIHGRLFDCLMRTMGDMCFDECMFLKAFKSQHLVGNVVFLCKISKHIRVLCHIWRTQQKKDSRINRNTVHSLYLQISLLLSFCTNNARTHMTWMQISCWRCFKADKLNGVLCVKVVIVCKHTTNIFHSAALSLTLCFPLTHFYLWKWLGFDVSNRATAEDDDKKVAHFAQSGPTCVEQNKIYNTNIWIVVDI